MSIQALGPMLPSAQWVLGALCLKLRADRAWCWSFTCIEKRG